MERATNTEGSSFSPAHARSPGRGVRIRPGAVRGRPCTPNLPVLRRRPAARAHTRTRDARFPTPSGAGWQAPAGAGEGLPSLPHIRAHWRCELLLSNTRAPRAGHGEPRPPPARGLPRTEGHAQTEAILRSFLKSHAGRHQLQSLLNRGLTEPR